MLRKLQRWTGTWSVVGMVLCAIGFSDLVAAEPGSGELFKRRILAIVDDDDEYDKIHRGVEVILNHLGLKVEYCYTSEALPADIENFRGIVVWSLDHEMTRAETCLKYMKKALDKGVKLLIFGQFPGFADEKSGNYVPAHDELVKACGFRKDRQVLKNPVTIEARRLMSEMIDFEQKFEHRGRQFQILESQRSDHEIALQVVERTSQRRSDLVVTGQFGGLSHGGATIVLRQGTGFKRWVLNPFMFFKKALDLKNYPVPDVSTYTGHRGLFCHLDGDGFAGICRFDRDRLVSEVVFDEVIEPYHFPISLSLVHIWFDPMVTEVEVDTVEDGKVIATFRSKINEEERARWYRIAKRVFEPAWVEEGLHGYGHPLYWDTGQLAIRSPGLKYSPELEIEESARFFHEITGRHAKTFHWSGDCMPTAEALAATEKAGLFNINGGDTLFDNEYDSYVHVAPLHRQVEGYRQVYATHSNENIYSNEWQGPFYGFRNVIEAFKRTESPRRMSPINIYYHWFSGEYKASVEALKEVYAWVASQPLNPIRTTDYIKSVHAFLDSEIVRRPNGGWLIRKATNLKTLRFEGEDRKPKVGPSYGVMGYLHEGEQLYVHLNGGPQSEIVWTDQEEPLLASANCTVNSWNIENDALKVDLWGWRPATLVFRNLPSPLKGVGVSQKGKETRIDIDPRGEHQWSFPFSATSSEAD